MRILLSFVLVLFTATVFSQDKDITNAKNLVNRIAPQFSEKIIFKKENSNKDFYELKSENGKLIITANSANSMAVGFNEFLKTYCKTSVSWYANDKVILPKTFPQIPTKIRTEARVKSRFFLNYCTFGYTMPWWKWQDWEHFIDWMALNGVNLPLAITGQEKIWLTVWKKFGLSDAEIRNYFVGPAYLPWHRMANIDGWESPLPMSWIESQAELQKKILERERAFNMTPILPAFAGHVPKVLKDKFPNAKITSLGEWGDFSEQYRSNFLDSFDPLFSKIQKAYLEEQTKLFGTDHIYGIDPFNEVTPPSWEPQYLADVSKNIYNSLTETDKNAQWLQMTWIFYFMQDKWTNERIKAFLRAVPQDKMILLDYFCEKEEIWPKTESYYGQPYIWCYLGNFGGNTMLDGNLKSIDQKIENTFKNGGKNLWGIGATLEGFGNNPIMYEYVLSKAWKNTNPENFVENYAENRYGNSDKNSKEAWKLLNEKIYVGNSDIGRGDLTNSKPSFDGHFFWTVNPDIQYNNQDLLKIWDLLLKSNPKSDVANNDLTVVGKQVLGNYFMKVRDEFSKAYKEKNVEKTEFYGKKMLEIINDIDELLASNKNYLVGKWIADARKFGIDEKEKNYYETDARKIITVWGEKGRGLNDYANRSTAGLMKDYYGGRWKIFVEQALNSLKNNQPFDDKKLLKDVDEFSENWAEAYNPYPALPKGNTLEISKKLYQKYSSAVSN